MLSLSNAPGRSIVSLEGRALRLHTRFLVVAMAAWIAACGQGLGPEDSQGKSTGGDLAANIQGVKGIKDSAAEAVTTARALGKDYLNPGEQLLRGEWLTSHNGQYIFVLQDDGNLVLYGPTGPLWASNTAGRSVRTAIMQHDGNLVMYGYDGQSVWDSNTPGQPLSWLTLQDDGKVVIYRSGAVWASNTMVYPGATEWFDPAVRDRLGEGEELLRGESMQSTNGIFSLRMQEDGNLVLYWYGYALWATNTDGIAVRTAVMQGDSNLVLYGYDNRPVWESNTSGRLNPTLILQNDGNLVMYSRWAIWWTAGR
jgi:hypothetical protein